MVNIYFSSELTKFDLFKTITSDSISNDKLKQVKND